EYAAALGDNDLVDVADRIARAAGERTNRAIAVIYAGQERNLDRALELIQEELKVRQDVYTYDALAWVLLKNGQIARAQEAIHKALRLNTPEPSFYYHASRIASAQGNEEEARRLMERARSLHPMFDPAI
ncbi:MAG: tetratricopeptide repeat protein, partial [Bryobacteraceae bacterium]